MQNLCQTNVDSPIYSRISSFSGETLSAGLFWPDKLIVKYVPVLSIEPSFGF